MPARQAAPCIKCNEIVEINEAAFVAKVELRTVGLEESAHAPSASIYICIDCANLMAHGDEPPARTQPLNHIVYQQVQDIVANDPTFALQTWLNLRKECGFPGPSLAEPKLMKALADMRRVLASPALIEQTAEESGPRRLREVG